MTSPRARSTKACVSPTPASAASGASRISALSFVMRVGNGSLHTLPFQRCLFLSCSAAARRRVACSPRAMRRRAGERHRRTVQTLPKSHTRPTAPTTAHDEKGHTPMSLHLCFDCSAPVEHRTLCRSCSRKRFNALRVAASPPEGDPPTMEAVSRELGKCPWCGAHDGPCAYADGDCDR